MKRFTGRATKFYGIRIGGLPLLMMLCFVTLSSAQKSYGVKAEEVLVFRNGGLIQAESEMIPITKGLGKLTLTGLGNEINEKSIYISLGEGVEILELKVIEDSTGYKKDKEILAIDKSINEWKDSLYWLDFSEKRNKVLELILLKNDEIEVSDKSIYVDDLNELLAFYERKLRKVKNEKVTIKHHKKIVNRHIDSLQTAKQNRITTLGYPTTSVELHIRSDMEQKRTARLSYSTDKMSWNPSYVIAPKNEEYALSTNANFIQKTGQNWEEVKVTLLYGQEESSATNLKTPLTRFELAGIYNFVADSSYRLPQIEKTEVVVEEKMVCRPNISTASQMMYQVNGLSGYYLPNSPVTLITSTSGQFVDSLESDFYNDSVVFVAGYHSDITCEKSIVLDKMKKSIFNGEQKQVLEWELKIQNNSGENLQVEVYDILPWKEDREVTCFPMMPKRGKYDKGRFSVVLELRAGETQTITYGVEIIAPKNYNLDKIYY